MSTQNSHHPSPPLQAYLAAPIASFARQGNYSYLSSQELATGARQIVFRYSGEGVR